MDFADSSHIRRLGDDIVNSYLVAEPAGVTIIDAGVPGYWHLVPGALEQMGKSLDDVRAMEIPMAQGQGGSGAGALLPVTPKRAGDRWEFEILGEKQTVALDALAARASADNRKIVLVVGPATPLQDFVAMQTTLAKAKVPFALAVQNKETAP